MKTHYRIAAEVACIVIFVTAFRGLAAEEKGKGTPAAPPDAKAVAGSYYRGDGLGYNITLTLDQDGEYTADWRGCLGNYGVASGKWSLSGKRIILAPSYEEGLMKGHLKSLDVLKYEGDWILLPTDKRERAFYEERGVTRYSCFQKRERIK